MSTSAGKKLRNFLDDLIDDYQEEQQRTIPQSKRRRKSTLTIESYALRKRTPGNISVN